MPSYTTIVHNGITRWTFPFGYLEWVIDPDLRSTAILCFIHVELPFRRQGLGYAMIHTWARHLLQHRIWSIELDNVLETDNKFYSNLGFKYKEKFDNTMRGKSSLVFSLSSEVALFILYKKTTSR